MLTGFWGFFGGSLENRVFGVLGVSQKVSKMSDINSDDLRRMPKSSYLGFSRDLGVLGSVDLMSGVVCADTAHVLLVTFWWCACCMGFVELFWGRLCWHSSRAVGDVLGGPGSCGFGVYLSDHRSFTCLIRIVLKEICGSDASRSLVDCWGLSCWAYWVVEHWSYYLVLCYCTIRNPAAQLLPCSVVLVVVLSTGVITEWWL